MTLVRTTGGPLCPLAAGPFMAMQHATMTQVSNVLHHVTQPMRNDGGEASPEVEKTVAHAQYGYDPNETGMRLYRAEAILAEGRYLPVLSVHAWYFQCHICGFVLPATPTEG